MTTNYAISTFTPQKRHHHHIIKPHLLQREHPAASVHAMPGVFVSKVPSLLLSDVNLHKTAPRSLAAKLAEFSNEIFKKRFECGIIFVKYATKAERMLRAAEMREKPI